MRLRVKQVRWVGGTTAGHVAEVQDQNNKVKWRSQATGANFEAQSEIHEPGADWDGIKVPTLGSGIVYIYLA